MRELYLVIAYDTPDDRRRARLAKLLKGFGERRQYSVFEARLTREQWAHLAHRPRGVEAPRGPRLRLASAKATLCKPPVPNRGFLLYRRLLF